MTKRSRLLVLGSALCAPFVIGVAFMAMVRDGWFGFDLAYLAFPAFTLALVTIVSVIPLIVVVVWLADEL